MTTEEFTVALKNWELEKDNKAVEKVKEEPSMKENEWECGFCKHLNEWFAGQKTSAHCKRCNQKNDMIMDMILMMGSAEYMNAEKQEYYEAKHGRVNPTAVPQQQSRV